MEKQLKYQEAELAVLKKAFAENDELLLIVRKLFFGFDLSEDEKSLIKTNFTPDVIEVFRKKVYGLDNIDSPIGQRNDFWVGVESQILGASPDAIKQVVESKQLVLSMFKKAFNLLENPDGEKVSIEIPMTILMADPLGISLIARNLYVQAVENSLNIVKVLSGLKSETVEQTTKRIMQNSTR